MSRILTKCRLCQMEQEAVNGEVSCPRCKQSYRLPEYRTTPEGELPKCGWFTRDRDGRVTSCQAGWSGGYAPWVDIDGNKIPLCVVHFEQIIGLLPAAPQYIRPIIPRPPLAGDYGTPSAVRYVRTEPAVQRPGDPWPERRRLLSAPRPAKALPLPSLPADPSEPEMVPAPTWLKCSHCSHVVPCPYHGNGVWRRPAEPKHCFDDYEPPLRVVSIEPSEPERHGPSVDRIDKLRAEAVHPINGKRPDLPQFRPEPFRFSWEGLHEESFKGLVHSTHYWEAVSGGSPDFTRDREYRKLIGWHTKRKRKVEAIA